MTSPSAQPTSPSLGRALLSVLHKMPSSKPTLAQRNQHELRMLGNWEYREAFLLGMRASLELAKQIESAPNTRASLTAFLAARNRIVRKLTQLVNAEEAKYRDN